MNILDNKKLRIVLRALLWVFALFFIAAMTCDFVVTRAGAEKTFDKVVDVPHNRVGLLLGTNPKTSNGEVNPYYAARIAAAVALYEAGKVDRLLVSGANRSAHYNEPDAMKSDLLAAGVPDSVIYLDCAGFRTYDSLVRAKEVFGQDSITIISQKFHNERALYIANGCGMEAVAFNAGNYQNEFWQIRMRLREYAARVRAIVDVEFEEYPHFLGEKIEIK